MKSSDSQKKYAGRGFTLAEMVVMVGILGGAMALLGGTLRDARENAKLTACQSNLGQVTQGFLMYGSDLGKVPVFTPSDYSVAVWNYGGWSGRNRTYWQGVFSEWNIQTNRRPLSVYMTHWPIPEQVDKYTPTQEMPVFKCPSDNISSQWQWGSSDPQYGLSAYDDVGTSYMLNWSWFQQTVDDCGCGWSEAGDLGPGIFQKYMEQDPSRFIVLMEDPCEYGLNINLISEQPGIQTQGWHGEFSKHVIAFSDGHVDYRYLDTRHLHDSVPFPPGPRHQKYGIVGEWTACDQTNDHPSGGRHL